MALDCPTSKKIYVPSRSSVTPGKLCICITDGVAPTLTVSSSTPMPRMISTVRTVLAYAICAFSQQSAAEAAL